MLGLIRNARLGTPTTSSGVPGRVLYKPTINDPYRASLLPSRFIAAPNDGIIAPLYNNSSTGNQNYTVAGWIKSPDGTPGDVVWQGNANASQIFNSNRLLFESGVLHYVVHNAADVNGGFGAIKANRWYHVGATINHTGPLLTIYQDGAAGGTSAIEVGSFGITNAMGIGCVADNGAVQATSGTNAYLLDIVIWNTVLSAGEMAQLASGKVSPWQIRPANLRRYYPLGKFGVTNFGRDAASDGTSIVGTRLAYDAPNAWRDWRPYPDILASPIAAPTPATGPIAILPHTIPVRNRQIRVPE